MRLSIFVQHMNVALQSAHSNPEGQLSQRREVHLRAHGSLKGAVVCDRGHLLLLLLVGVVEAVLSRGHLLPHAVIGVYRMRGGHL